MRLSPCVLVQPDGWARGEREGYGEPCDVTSLSLSPEREGYGEPRDVTSLSLSPRRPMRHRRDIDSGVRLAHTSKTKHLEQILVPQPRRRVHEPRVEALPHLFTCAVEQEPARPHQVEHDARVRS